MEDERILAKEGMRVRVTTCDGENIDILGVIKEVVPIDIEEDGGTITRFLDDYPSIIKLDNGAITEGCKCWWTPEDES